MNAKYVSLGMVAAMAAAAACASAPPGPEPVLEQAPDPPPTVLTGATSSEVRLATETRAFEGVINAPRDSVLRVLPGVWEDLKIPIGQFLRAQGTLRSPRFRVPRFEGRPLRDYFDCGYSIAGPRADLWEITAEVTTAVKTGATPDETRISTVIQASARPRDGSGTQPVACTSFGRLERRITERLGGRS